MEASPVYQEQPTAVQQYFDHFLKITDMIALPTGEKLKYAEAKEIFLSLSETDQPYLANLLARRDWVSQHPLPPPFEFWSNLCFSNFLLEKYLLEELVPHLSIFYLSQNHLHLLIKPKILL